MNADQFELYVALGSLFRGQACRTYSSEQTRHDLKCDGPVLLNLGGFRFTRIMVRSGVTWCSASEPIQN